ncbi:AfsR/SARP family transcriptional regulator [Paractinoplanes lichenicola]|uniref:AfsR/SARP family transcriptional regulator n=1 Tax=Paractinoplanes lichenicola TaxID=2802976 RepID=A0ABS1VEI2_9ACTN|nr:AfsR/SARP family transcriptional regulator [Actinoplanes lichenicola]MBL7253103.1 AfsR/SARP family transcriptional regulator [Actinoplanes lichenicola]
MRYQILGPLLVEHEQQTRSVTGGKVRTMLAALLLHANQQLSVAQLAQRMWSGDAPHSLRRVVQTNIVRLRHELPWPGSVVTGPAGYSLSVEPGELDMHVFDRLVDEASAAPGPADQARLLREALGLWRGPACADVASPWLHEMDLPALNERRLLALERRIEVDLRLHQADGLVPELRRLTMEHPFRERFWVQLMAALYRQGRQAEALSAYQTLSHRFIDVLGVEPGEELREVHQQILRGSGHHPLLSPAAAPAPVHVAPAPPAVPRMLPAGPPHFVGRAEEFATLDWHRDEEAGVVVLDGPAGIGKSALALRWLHDNAADFADGQLYVDLRGYADEPPLEPADALATLLGDLGVAEAELPCGVAARAQLFRTLTADRRLAVLLDNALDAEQVRPLLPGAAGVVVVITSRNQLRGLVVHDGAVRVTVPRLEPAEAPVLLGMNPRTEEAARLAELCDRTPLALRILAERMARLPHVSPASWIAELSGEAGRLAALDAGDGASGDLPRSLSWSYRRLDPDAAELMRCLSAHTTRAFTTEQAAGVATLPIPAVRQQLDRLVGVHLVEQLNHDLYRVSLLAGLYGRHCAIGSVL